MSNHIGFTCKPLRLIHFSPSASFARKFLFHPKLHEAREGVHFFAIGKSGYSADRSSALRIVREYLRAIKLLFGGIMAANRQTVAYCHTTIYALPALLLCRLCGVGEVVYFNHGVPFVGYRGIPRLALQAIDRLNVAIAHRFMTVSPAMVPFLKVDRQDTIWHHSTRPGSSSGLRADDYDKPILSVLRQHQQSKVVRYLYAGRLQERKGVFVLLEAWRLHVSRFPHDELWLCGFTTEELEVQVNLAGLKQVKVQGYVNDMAWIYPKIDVVVSPSFHEGFGYTLAEGAARGCCIISSNVPGPDVMFTAWMRGQLFSARDPQALADVMARLSESQTTLAVAKLLSYRSALRFRWDKVAFPNTFGI